MSAQRPSDKATTLAFYELHGVLDYERKEDPSCSCEFCETIRRARVIDAELTARDTEDVIDQVNISEVFLCVALETLDQIAAMTKHGKASVHARATATFIRTQAKASELQEAK